MSDKRSKITILSPPTGQGDYGEASGTWTTFKPDIWASKDPILGKEYFAANAAQSDVSVKFRCHWFSGVLNTMRIQHGSEVYQILSAINVKEQNRELLCYCKRVV